MANQAIALQARAPQGNFLAPAIQQGAQFINMMSQQRAAERQAAAQEQSMRLQMAGEGRAAAEARRAAELQPFKVDEAKNKSISDAIKVGMEFNKYINMSAADANSPEDFRAFAADIAANPLFQSDIFKNGLSQVVASIPNDPARFAEWKRQTGLKTIEKDKLYKKELIKQETADGTRQIAVDPYNDGAATVVPGSEVSLGQEITYVKGSNGEVIPMPKRMAPAGGGLVGGARGGVAATPVATALQTNPGAIRDGAFARSQPGYAGVSGGFATFNTPQAGVAAQENLLRGSYVAKGFNTINKIIDRYSPAGGENPPAAVANYKAYVARRAGIDTNAPITAAQVPVVAAAMREFETGQRPTGAPAVAPAAGGGVQFGQPIPGTGGPKPLTAAQEAKLRTNIAKDYKTAESTIDAMTNPVSGVLAAVKAVRDLTPDQKEAMTGISGYLPSVTGASKTAGTKFKNLIGKVTALGKAQAALSGAIGPMAVQEWKIVRDLIADLEVTGMGAKDLDNQLDIIESAAQGAADRVRDTYLNQYAEEFERYPNRFQLKEPRGPAGAGKPLRFNPVTGGFE